MLSRPRPLLPQRFPQNQRPAKISKNFRRAHGSPASSSGIPPTDPLQAKCKLTPQVLRDLLHLILIHLLLRPLQISQRRFLASNGALDDRKLAPLANSLRLPQHQLQPLNHNVRYPLPFKRRLRLHRPVQLVWNLQSRLHVPRLSDFQKTRFSLASLAPRSHAILI